MTEKLTFLDLTWYQHLHDTSAHRDIAVLPKMKRLSHLNNHMAKYICKTDIDLTTLADMLAVTLSAAFAFNVDLNKAIYVRTLTEKSKSFLHLTAPELYSYDKELLVKQLRKNLIDMSKTIESFDHIEDIDFIGRIKNTLIENAILTIQLHHCLFGEGESPLESLRGLITVYHGRLSTIRAANPFYDYILMELQNKPSYKVVINLIENYLGKQ